MVRGLRFQIPNKYSSFINQILKGIDLNNYIWRLVEDDVWIDADTYLFSSEVLNGLELQKAISHSSYYTYFLQLQAYSSGIGYFGEITSYEDFMHSDCLFVVFIADAVFVNVYAKDINLIEIIKANALENGFSDVDYITDQNDTRIEFSAN